MFIYFINFFYLLIIYCHYRVNNTANDNIIQPNDNVYDHIKEGMFNN